MEDEIQKRRLSFLSVALIGFLIAVVAGLAEALAGLGTRWGAWNYRAGFSILRWAAYGGIAAAAVSLAGAVLTRKDASRIGIVLSLTGLLTGIAVVGVPWSFQQTARRVPPINDITTNTDNPPGFVAIAPVRQKQGVPVAYRGQEFAAKQQAAYPDILPLTLSAPAGDAFVLALNAARSLGWQIVDANPQEGRIEATDTTFWFGFKDDVVVRITPVGEGSRIDVRSASRVGRGDLGTNAKRIREYLKKVQGK